MTDWKEYKKDNDRLLKENAELKKTTEFLRSMLGKSNDKVIKLKAERDEMESENERLKLMLKQAIKDFESLRQKFSCVENEKFDCDTCEYGRSEHYHQAWRYKGQALKLIGDDE